MLRKPFQFTRVLSLSFFDGLRCMPLFWCILTIFMSFWGCAASAIEKDLVNYINQDILGVVEVEQAALDRYAAVSGLNYTSDQKLYNTLKSEIIPTYTGFVRVLDQIEPETDAIKQLHAKFLTGSVYRLRGFQTIMGGIRTQDAQLIRAANDLLNDGAFEIALWQSELLKLYEKYGIRKNPLHSTP